MSTRVGLIADVHGNLVALTATPQACDGAGVDQIVFLGDAVDIGPRPKEVLQLLHSRRHLLCICGNHDHWAAFGSPPSRPDSPGKEQLAHEAWTFEEIGPALRDAVAAWPVQHDETIEGRSVSFIHYRMTGITEWASPSFAEDPHELDAQFRPQTQVLCFGHDHHVLDVGDTHRYLNPGAVGTGHDTHARYAIVDFVPGGVHVAMRQVSYDRDAVLHDLEDRAVPDREAIRRRFFGVS